MAVGTGTASMGDIRTEWGRSGAISMSEMYRGGSHVAQKASDNTGTNDAASVPTSGVISIDDFRGSAKGFTFTFTATATDQDASTLFGDDFDLNYPKNIVINSGVELGATSTSEEALEVPSGGAGTITITNNGTLSGAGGAAGSDGGDAFEAATTCIFINNGTVRAGGGGGGSGGQGSYQTAGSSTYKGYGYDNNPSCGCYHCSCTSRYGGNAYCGGDCDSNGMGWPRCNNCYVQNYVTNYENGGSGGVGAGYNQSSGTGASGSNNAGDGGNGGGYGSAGSTGTNGNNTNGAAGGAAGKYLRGSSFVTFTNNGTAQGGTA